MQAAGFLTRCDGDRTLSNTLVSPLADGRLLAWEGRGTVLPLGFAALRMRTNDLLCTAVEILPDHVGPEVERAATADAVQLLCRALRLAPLCYRRIELMAAQPHKPLTITGETRLLSATGGNIYCDRAVEWQSIAGLAAAMRRFEAAEGVSVCMTRDEQCIIVHRNNNS